MFKWAHLSDLHFQEKGGYTIDKAREELPEYLRQKVGECDALFITGDFRFAKESDGDVDAICGYVDTVKDAIKAKCILCVPGNHDLKRTKMRTALIEQIVNKYDSSNKGYFDTEIEEYLNSGFGFFKEIETRLNSNQKLIEGNKIHKTISLEQCDILLLNTAITAGRDEERGSLVMGINYLKDALKERNHDKPVIVLGHHGASFWQREEQKLIFDLFEKEKIKLYLCGHEHALYNEYIGNNAILQITAGCLKKDSCEAQVGFSSGILGNDNKVSYEIHFWENGTTYSWMSLQKKENVIELGSRYSREKAEVTNSSIADLILNYPASEKKTYNFLLDGYTPLGNRGRNGMKYYWKKGEDRVESLTFNQRLSEPSKDPKQSQEDNSISAYTTSMSFGCILSANSMQCRFCETGSRPFKGFLSAEEIAMQNIFMVACDAGWPNYPEVRNHKREFAFMGQGEPGYQYSTVREAIRLTDIAMKKMDQQVYRYNISSCGVYDFIPSLIDDIKSGIFDNKVTLHFSLHASGEERNRIMPINKEYNYREFIYWCEKLYEVTHEKIGVGLMMFKGFMPNQRVGEQNFDAYTLTGIKLQEILRELKSEIFSIDLCELNKTSVIAKQDEMTNMEAEKLLEIANAYGFETKIFSSFGRDQSAGCGMLSSDFIDANEDVKIFEEQYSISLDLLNYAVHSLTKSNKTENVTIYGQ